MLIYCRYKSVIKLIALQTYLTELEIIFLSVSLYIPYSEKCLK